MFKNSKAFASFSVGDIDAAKKFYEEKLGLEVEQDPHMGNLMIYTNGNNPIMVYPKDNHEPATFTTLNFPVDDIEKSVDELASKGIVFEQYDMPGIKTDEKGVSAWEGGGPKMAWFKDPSGNILSLIQEK